MSLVSSDLSNDIYLISEGLKNLEIMESNALGLVFFSDEEVLETKAIATSTPQAESLRAPPYHQDDRSCGRPTQKYHVQQEHAAFQLDGPTGDTLVGRFPQDIGQWADVRDDTGPKVSKRNREAIPADREDVSFQVFQGLFGAPFEEAHSFGDGGAQPDTYDYNLEAPRLKSIPLPMEQDYDEDLLYGGPALGGWLTGTLDGVPKTMMPGLGGLDIDLPMPFAMEV